MEVFAGEKATAIYGEDVYLPDETIDTLKSFIVSIKGPLATPVGGGIRSLNVALRQSLDLYVCLRPIRYYQGVPSPVKNPQNVNMVIFRENTEDIYAGIEYGASSDKAKKIIGLLDEFGDKNKIRFPNSAAIGIKPVSKEGSQRLIRKAIEYAIDNKFQSVADAWPSSLNCDEAKKKWKFSSSENFEKFIKKIINEMIKNEKN